MEDRDIRDILKTKNDLELFDEYSKYITIGVMSKYGINNMQKSVISEGIFEQALYMVEHRKKIKTILETKK